ncbi:G-D-S-L family lipolytic protein [Mesonia maritima]
MSDNIGGLLLNGEQITNTKLILDVGASGSPAPTNIQGTPSTEITNTLSGSFNNMGVPGAKSYELLAPGYGNAAGLQAEPKTANPYFVRFRSSAETTVLKDAVAQNPTFFSLWIGNNDVLGYATSGGVGVNQTGNLDPKTYNRNDITDPNVFANFYSQEVEALTASASGGVLINIPDVAATPFFTRIPFDPITPAALGDRITQLNQTYAQLNQAFAFIGVPERSIQFSTTGPSAVVIQDESLTDISEQLTQVLMAGGLPQTQATIYGMQYGQARQATENDLILLTSQSAIGTVNTERVQELVGLGVPQELAGQLSINGVSYPMEDQHVLIPAEQEEIATVTATYNATIEAIATSKGLAFVDANTLLNNVANGGVMYDGGIITSEFATGGAFSLDGIHLTPRGYAVIANKIIEEVNETYNATVPKVNVGTYRGDPAIGSGVME